MKIQSILLDFGGTLDADGLDWYDRFYCISRDQGLPLAREEFDQVGKQAGRNIYQHEDIGRLDLDRTAHRLMAEFGKLLPDDTSFDPASAAESFLSQSRVSLARNLEVIRELSKHFTLGVLSNNWGNAEGWCDQYGYLPFLDVVVDSGLVGVSKPERRIFEIGLERLGLPASAVAYVGDRYQTDMVGAKGAGLTTVWVRHPSNTGDSTDGAVDYAIASLPQLLKIKDRWLDV